MRIGLQILIAVTLFACIMTAVGYVLLVQLNKPESLAKGMGEVIKNSTQIAAFGVFIFIVMAGDRKSTRLNSSHSQISYAVFCLKKKKHTAHHQTIYNFTSNKHNCVCNVIYES